MQISFCFNGKELEEYNAYFLEFYGANAWQKSKLAWTLPWISAVLVAIIVWWLTSWILAVCLIGILVLIVGPPYFSSWMTYRKGDSDEKTVTFNKAGREAILQDSRLSTVWQNYNLVAETDLLFLLHFENQIEAFPKRAFTASQLDTLRQWTSGIDHSKPTDSTKLFQETLAEKPADLLFTYEYQDYLDTMSEPSTPVLVDSQDVVENAALKSQVNIFTEFVWLFAIGLLIGGFILHAQYIDSENLYSAAGIVAVAFVVWFGLLIVIGEKSSIDPPTEELEKAFPVSKYVFIRDEGIAAGIPSSFGFFDWKDVDWISENIHCYQLGVLNSAQVIPKRIFENESESKQFLKKMVAARRERRRTNVMVEETGNPFQSPTVSSIAQVDEPIYLAPPWSRLTIGPMTIFFFLVSTVMLIFAIGILVEYFVGSEILLVAVLGTVLMAGCSIFMFVAGRKCIPLWRSRSVRYRADDQTLWLNNKAYSHDELRLRIKQKAGLASIMKGDETLATISFQYPSYRHVKQLISSE